MPVPFKVTKSTELYTDLLFWMDHVERKHILKGLCHIPAFFKNPET